MVLRVLTSTSYISHKWLIIVGQKEADKMSIFFCNEDDGVDNGDDDSVGNGDDGGVDDGAEGADKHLVYLSQVADCCRTERSKQNEIL
eukprot:15245166-Ditylum_brightwellii.AAC.1